jgi:hypothetical protein
MRRASGLRPSALLFMVEWRGPSRPSPGMCNPADDTCWHPEKLLRAEDDEW